MSMLNDDAVVGLTSPTYTTRIPLPKDTFEACKDVRLGAQLVKLTLDAYYNAIRPEANHETWLLKTTLTFQFPN